MLALPWARCVSSCGAFERTEPSLPINFARRDFGLKWTLPGVMVSAV